MPRKLTDLELAAIIAWKTWGSEWMLYTTCTGCGEVKTCRGKRRSAMLCLECWDQGKG